MNGLTYTKVGDYYLPNLVLKEQPDTPIGKYGAHEAPLSERTPERPYTSLLLTEKIYPHLLEIDEAANERMDILMPQLMKAAGVTEELKAADQMKWWAANNCKAQAEGICAGSRLVKSGGLW